MSRALTCTQEEMAQVFTAAALMNGNMKRAAKDLNAERRAAGKPTWSVDSMNRWRRENRALYDRILREVQERVRLQEAELQMAAAAEAREVSSELTRRLGKEVGDIPTRDLPGALRNAATAAGIHIDKALALTGDGAGGMTVNINLAETIRGLAGQGTKFYDANGKELTPDEAEREAIEGTARALPDTPELPVAPHA